MKEGHVNDKITTAWAWVVAVLIYGLFIFTTAWAWVVAVLIHGLFIFTAFVYFGEIVMWLQERLYG